MDDLTEEHDISPCTKKGVYEDMRPRAVHCELVQEVFSVLEVQGRDLDDVNSKIKRMEVQIKELQKKTHDL